MKEVDKQEKVFFIIGNSRSGTTMMMRILNNHHSVHSINEPHFFEQIWSTSDQNKQIEEKDAIQLFSRLLFLQRDGQHNKMLIEKYRSEAEEQVKNIVDLPLSKLKIYEHFLFYETKKNGKIIPCEKTPQNVFYIEEILQNFPNAKVINLTRDPRAVLLSQKRKWKRRNLGARFLPKKELIRLRINYHPITISKLWNSSINAASQFTNHSQFISIRYEDLLKSPEKTIQELCDRLNIPFDKKLLAIPQAGSSSEPDRLESLGIRSHRTDAWKKGGLNQAELFICEKITGKLIKQLNYERQIANPNWLLVCFYLMSFPVKLFLALIWNRKRVVSIIESLRRRLSQT